MVECLEDFGVKENFYRLGGKDIVFLCDLGGAQSDNYRTSTPIRAQKTVSSRLRRSTLISSTLPASEPRRAHQTLREGQTKSILPARYLVNLRLQ